VIDPSARVHPSADLEDDVSIGPDTSVWHRAQLRTGVRIGAESVVGRDAFIDEGVTIGDRVKIQNAALIYRGVTVGDGVFIGPGAILTNDRHPRAITSSGDLAAAEDWTVSPIRVDRGASIGAGAVIVAGVAVEEFAMVGAGAVVTRDVASYALVAGNPANRLGWVCSCGARLRTADGQSAPAEPDRYSTHPELTCPECGRRFQYVPDEDRLQPMAPGQTAQGRPA
jgi:acetyltransferase-like isoleucine patch superfamily enzyme